MQRQQQQQAPHGSFPNLQYYAISQSVASVNDNNPDNVAPAHIHPINLCATPGAVISQHQLQDILPGAVFGDPSMGHLHYHIYPSRRALEAGPGQCRSHSRLEQVQHHHGHYPRQTRQLVQRPPTSLDELAKERDRASVNLENLGMRYAHVARDAGEKSKNISLMELSDDSQVSWGFS